MMYLPSEFPTFLYMKKAKALGMFKTGDHWAAIARNHAMQDLFAFYLCECEGDFKCAGHQ